MIQQDFCYQLGIEFTRSSFLSCESCKSCLKSLRPGKAYFSAAAISDFELLKSNRM